VKVTQGISNQIDKSLYFMSAIKVFIVDDHYMVRMGLRGILSRNDTINVVGEAQNGEDAVQLCLELQPDVLLMDMVLPGISGSEAATRILNTCTNTRIIALTSFSDMAQAAAAIEAGVCGYLLKDISGDDLIDAIRQVHAGGMVFPPEITRALASRPQVKQIRSLTQREQEVLLLVAKGYTNQQIAFELHIGSSTVKDHISSIFAKLQVNNRAEAAALAIQYRLIDSNV
jgi:DNA-binding NarL/FixJ family response regulator